MTTWRDLITTEMQKHGDSLSEVVAQFAPGAAPNDWSWMDRAFDHEWPQLEGTPFTVWTSRRVYFPAQHDGEEWCASVARHPAPCATLHVGRGGFPTERSPLRLSPVPRNGSEG